MNELRKNYKTFEEGLKDYVANWKAREKDFGNYSEPNEKELKQLTDRFKVLWESENCKMEEMEFKDY